MKNIKNINDAVSIYTSAWNEADRESILEKLSQCLAPEVSYTDNITDTIVGLDALTDFILSSYEHMGPRSFHLMAEPNNHHQTALYRWLAVRDNGFPMDGLDFAEFDSEYRITRIVGFI